MDTRKLEMIVGPEKAAELLSAPLSSMVSRLIDEVGDALLEKQSRERLGRQAPPRKQWAVYRETCRACEIAWALSPRMNGIFKAMDEGLPVSLGMMREVVLMMIAHEILPKTTPLPEIDPAGRLIGRAGDIVWYVGRDTECEIVWGELTIAGGLVSGGAPKDSSPQAREAVVRLIEASYPAAQAIATVAKLGELAAP